MHLRVYVLIPNKSNLSHVYWILCIHLRIQWFALFWIFPDQWKFLNGWTSESIFVWSVETNAPWNLCHIILLKSRLQGSLFRQVFICIVSWLKVFLVINHVIYLKIKNIKLHFLFSSKLDWVCFSESMLQTWRSNLYENWFLTFC